MMIATPIVEDLFTVVSPVLSDAIVQGKINDLRDLTNATFNQLIAQIDGAPEVDNASRCENFCSLQSRTRQN